MSFENVLQELENLADAEKAVFLSRYFKTGKGQYGENDVFLGITVPVLRSIAKKYKTLPLDDVRLLLDSAYHEVRMTGLLALCGQFNLSKDEAKRREIFDFYLQNTDRINNWDLVDITCRDIVGGYLLDKKDRSILYRLAASNSLWEQRIAIISTWTFIKNHEYADTLNISRQLITHKHDLIHKAIGWMLRETGKKDKAVLTAFLDEYRTQLPRTALRYAIERFPQDEKKKYMK
ncbi:MAG: DNA alkylation repair protein [Bacteroidales bacterium]|nr:DNA alkylation repair protein [Bacteroidales bacterium]